MNRVRHLVFAVVSMMMVLLPCPTATAQSVASPKVQTRGKLYVHVDDSATIFLNGSEVHHGTWGVSTSREIPLEEGDRLVIRLWNQVGPKGMKLLFVSSDRKRAIHFAAAHFRIWRDPDKLDFAHAQFGRLQPVPKLKGAPKKDGLTFKNTAEWLWGDGDVGNCFVACEIGRSMFTSFSP